MKELILEVGELERVNQERDLVEGERSKEEMKRELASLALA